MYWFSASRLFGVTPAHSFISAEKAGWKRRNCFRTGPEWLVYLCVKLGGEKLVVVKQNYQPQAISDLIQNIGKY